MSLGKRNWNCLYGRGQAEEPRGCELRPPPLRQSSTEGGDLQVTTIRNCLRAISLVLISHLVTQFNFFYVYIFIFINIEMHGKD